MTMRAQIGAVLMAAVVLASDPLFACGDKFLLLGRGTRYERSPAARQASAVLMYVNPASQLSRTLAALSVDATLRKAGYRPTVVASVDDLDKALRAGRWDLVVADAADSETVSQHARGSAAPRVVPVLNKPTKTELKQAKGQFRTVLDTPSRSGAFVDVIDDEMDLREAEVKAAARKAAR